MDIIGLLLETITAFGDSGLVLPASLGLVALLLAAEDRRSAVAVAAAVASCAVLTAVAKIAFMIVGATPLRSPSGHAAMATVFFACFGAIVWRSRERGGSACWSVLACAALALLVAVSRVSLGAHSWGEIWIGMAIGLVCFGLFWRLASPRPPLRHRALFGFFAVTLAFYAAFGESVSVEDSLERVASRLERTLRR